MNNSYGQEQKVAYSSPTPVFHSPQVKKGRDEALDVSLSGDTKHKQGKKINLERMPAHADNQPVDTNHLDITELKGGDN